MINKKKVALLVNSAMAASVFTPDDLNILGSFADFNDISLLPEKMTVEFMLDAIKGADACMTCWGTPRLTPEMLAAAPDLKLVAHMAGSIKALIPPELWKTRCRVTSNAPIIAEDVAQTVLAFTLTSLLQLWGNSAETRQGGWKGGEKGVFKTKKINGLTIGVVGLSYVGREVIKIFKPFDCKFLLYDPYACEIEARKYGARLCSLEELLANSDVVTLHPPANEDCRHLINAANIPLMRDGTLFINTSRGMTVDEGALVRELESGRIFACLDVTDPEPPVKDHPFRRLDNVILTSHVAGGHTDNGRKRLGANSIMQVYNYLTKGYLEYEVREEMLEHMA